MRAQKKEQTREGRDGGTYELLPYDGSGRVAGQVVLDEGEMAWRDGRGETATWWRDCQTARWALGLEE